MIGDGRCYCAAGDGVDGKATRSYAGKMSATARVCFDPPCYHYHRCFALSCSTPTRIEEWKAVARICWCTCSPPPEWAIQI